jgi:hypothetical protein
VRLAARTGIDAALTTQSLDAVVAPHMTNATAAAIAGYPSLSLPVGITPDGKPAGMLMYSGFLREPTLLGMAYDLEQAMSVRLQPQFLGSVALPPNAGLCPVTQPPEVFKDKAHLPHGRIFR